MAMDAKAEIDPSEWGLVTWHTSEEGGGPDCGYSLGLGDGRMLWCGEISKQRHAEAGEEAVAIGNDFGWWIIIYDGQSNSVVAKCINHIAAREMVDAIAAAMRESGEA